MTNSPRFRIRQVFCGLIASLSVAGAALADGDRRAPRTPLLPKYQQECAACHVAYPPGMLPAASWQRVMGNLSHHYGTDASLDPAAASRDLAASSLYSSSFSCPVISVKLELKSR